LTYGKDCVIEAVTFLNQFVAKPEKKPLGLKKLKISIIFQGWQKQVLRLHHYAPNLKKCQLGQLSTNNHYSDAFYKT